MEGGIPMVLSEAQFYILIFLISMVFVGAPVAYLLIRGSRPSSDSDITLEPRAPVSSAPRLGRVRGMSETEYRRASSWLRQLFPEVEAVKRRRRGPRERFSITPRALSRP